VTELNVGIQGSGSTFVALEQNFHQYGDDFVEVRSVSPDDLAATADWRFVPPAGEWDTAPEKLRDHRALIVIGDIGSGRRTAALRLLRSCCEQDRLRELEPVWARPRTRLLPLGTRGHGYLLDMTEPTKEPISEDFVRQLFVWAQSNDSYLIVTATAGVPTGHWTADSRSAVVRLGSPDARQLVEIELRAAHAADRSVILADALFERIWHSAPKAEDACRLARIIIESADLLPARIADEYGDWRDWIDEQLPSDLGARALLWSCAFCDGGRRKSVLKMAEALRRKLGEPRTPADILGDQPASRRLSMAKVERAEDRVRLAPGQHGLPAAVRRYLWDEFEDQQEILAEWAVEQVGTLPYEDAERVVDSLLDLVIRYRDESLLRRLRDALIGERRPLAVRAFSAAALDPRFGAQVRARLYTWLAHSPSQAIVDLVAEVSGGRFGQEKPTMALVRLRKAAQESRAGSPALATAFTALAARHPALVSDAIDNWFAATPPPTEAINAHLALASQERGATMLCGKAGYDPIFRDKLVSRFRSALSNPASRDATDSVLGKWAELVDQDSLDEAIAIDVIGAAVAPWVQDNIMQRFLGSDEPFDVHTFWGKVLASALRARNTSTDAQGN